MDVTGFIEERVGLFKDFPSERIKELVDGSLDSIGNARFFRGGPLF